MEAKVLDTLGNNAIVECSECDKPYLVSSFYSSPRPCPHCGKTKASMAKGTKVITIEQSR
jgi:hypothetical protein